MIKRIKIKDIRIDGGTQHRKRDEGVVIKYKALMEEGIKFPPIEVVFDGKDYWLWDGFHRMFAVMQLQIEEIQAHIVKGSSVDAVVLSFGANKDQGLPRCHGLAKTILKNLLRNPKCVKWSFSKVAKHVGVTKRYVSKIARELGIENPQKEVEYTTPSGKKATRKKSEAKKSKEPKDPEKLYDSTGEEVPENIKDVFTRVKEFKAMINQLNSMLRIVKKGKANGDILYRAINLEAFIAQSNDLKRRIKHSMPYAVCPCCFSDPNNDKCKPCSGTGWVTELVWKCIPEDIKGDRK